MENMERELNRKAKDLGIKNKKPSRKGEGGDRLLFRMGQQFPPSVVGKVWGGFHIHSAPPRAN